MKIEFADNRITEYVNGQFYAKNTGEPVDVSAANAAEFLNAKHWLDGEFVNVFRPVGVTAKETAKADLSSTYPEGFPSADILSAAGFSHEAAILLTHEQLLEIKGIGEKSAEAILTFSTEK